MGRTRQRTPSIDGENHERKIAAVVTASALTIGLGAAVAAPANAGIQLWDHDNYSGDYLGDFGRGSYNVGSFANDRATALRVTSPANYTILHEHAGYGGRQTRKFYTGTANLGWYDFNDMTTSIS